MLISPASAPTLPVPTPAAPTPDRLVALGRIFAADLPLTRHLGLTVAGWDDDALTLQLPLAGNGNPGGTLFAGSLNAAATLAGWGVLWLLIDAAGLGGSIVIQDSAIRYLQPVTGDVTVHGLAPAARELERFLAALRRGRPARLALAAEVRQGDAVAVHFHGRYVAQHLPNGRPEGRP